MLLMGGGSGGGEGMDLNALQSLLDNYVKKAEFDLLKKDVEKTQKKATKAKRLAKELNPRVNDLERDVEMLKKLLQNKIDCQVFDEEIEKIKNLINQLASSGKEIKAPIVQSGPQLSSRELNDMRETMRKVAEHEEKINKLQLDLKAINLDAIIKKLSALQEELKQKAEKTEILRLESEKAEKLYVEGEVARINREIESLKNWLSSLDTKLT